MLYILRCPRCETLFKCAKTLEGEFITDFGDKLKNNCIHCNNPLDKKIMQTDDWIANLIFKVKGN